MHYPPRFKCRIGSHVKPQAPPKPYRGHRCVRDFLSVTALKPLEERWRSGESGPESIRASTRAMPVEPKRKTIAWHEERTYWVAAFAESLQSAAPRAVGSRLGFEV